VVFKEIIRAIHVLEDLIQIRHQVKEDIFLQGSLLWYLYVVVQGSIDLAIKIISDLRLGSPETYAEAIEILHRHKLVSKEFKEKLITMTKFRHLLAHAYPRIDIEKILQELPDDLNDIRGYLKELDRNLKKYNKKIEDY